MIGKYLKNDVGNGVFHKRSLSDIYSHERSAAFPLSSGRGGKGGEGQRPLSRSLDLKWGAGEYNFGQHDEIFPPPNPVPIFFTRKGGIIPPPRPSQFYRVHDLYQKIGKKIDILVGLVYF